MRELPSGTVTFLFSDIEGSTRLLYELGAERYATALADHRRVLRDAFARCGGVVVDTQGDAFFVAFPTAPGALAAAADASAVLAGSAMRVRIAVHTGTPFLADEGYVGVDVSRAARIAAAGHGGQVLVSASTAALAESIELGDLGEHRFKDLAAPERVYQIGTRQFPPLKSLYRTNLPVPATPFLGREHELAAVTELLADEDVHLLTLTGPGGTGKTRLALQAAAEAAEAFPDGITWVSFAALRDPTLVLPTVAQALELPEQSGRETGERIVSSLAGKRQLLLLDNAEHLLPYVATDVARLRDLGGGTVLVTSRERLQLRGEHVYAVPPLGFEDGVDLFTTCARSLDVSFTPTAAVAELCARLDNLPLALELAAARTPLFSVDQLLGRLGQRLDLFRGGRDADPRQQTLRATIEWSHDLLTVPEKRLFRELSIFAGGCTYEAAERIAHADADALQSLIDKSLLRRRESESGSRYWMLETIRDFAAERLEEKSDHDNLERMHADFFVAFAERFAELRRRREGLRQLLDEVTADHANLRTALAWSLDREEPELAIRLFASVHDFWIRTDQIIEGRRWAEQALGYVAQVSPRLRQRALYAAAQLAYFSGDLAAAGTLYTRCLEVARELDDEWLIAWLIMRLAMVDSASGDPLAARRQLEESLHLCRSLGDQHTTAVALQLLGSVERDLGNTDRAKQLLGESVELLRSHGTAARLGAAIHGLGDVFLDEKAFEEATSYYAEGLRIARELGSDRDAAYCLAGLASASAGVGATDNAARLWGAVEAIETRIEVRLNDTERARYEHLLGALDHGLVEEGRELGLDAAVSLALESNA